MQFRQREAVGVKEAFPGYEAPARGADKPTASVLMPTLPQKPFQQLTWRMWRLTTLVSKTGAVAHNFPIGMSFGSCIEHLHIKLLVDWLRTRTGFFCRFQLCHGNKTSAQRDRNA